MLVKLSKKIIITNINMKMESRLGQELFSTHLYIILPSVIVLSLKDQYYI